VLGYVGLDKLLGTGGPTGNNVTIYRRFRLWNLGTDEVIATSPDLPSLVDSAFALMQRETLCSSTPLHGWRAAFLRDSVIAGNHAMAAH